MRNEIKWFMLFSFKVCLLSSVEFLCFVCRNDAVWFLMARNQGHFEPANNYQRYIALRNNRISREFNMAAIMARSAKSVSYHDLYNLSIADLLFDEKKKKRRPANKSLGFFEAER